jgi:hypothetical protein
MNESFGCRPLAVALRYVPLTEGTEINLRQWPARSATGGSFSDQVETLKE